MTLVVITSGTSWTPPADCASLNWVDCIGSGSAGSISGTSVRGGAGGAWARKNSVPVTPGVPIAISLGVNQDTVFGGTVLTSCICGAAKAVGPVGGQAANCVGDLAYSGGDGNTTFGGAGGAAGPYGPGDDGAGYAGGAGDAGYGGGASPVNTAGKDGTEYDGVHGSGGGAGGRNNAGVGMAGGLYGGGGGGRPSGAPFGAGRQGLIVINYTPTANAVLAVTEGADTFAGTAALKLPAALAVTEGADTASCTLSLQLLADLDATEEPDIASMSTGYVLFAVMDAAEAPDEAAGTIGLGWNLDLAVTEGADTAAGTLSMTSIAAMGAVEAADGFSSTAMISNSGTTPVTSEAPYRGADYLDLISSEHRGKRRFTSTIAASISPEAALQGALADLPGAFDLDTAIGVQLDAVGAWVGISRLIQIPLISVWFSFDIAGRGFDEGIWKGPYDPETGIYELDDDTYRKLIRLQILVNNWDGLTESARAAIVAFYASEGSLPFVLDNGNMSMTACISGARPPALMFAIFAGRYVEFKPAGVRLDTVVPSEPGTAAFGFDVENEYVGGFDSASWPRDARDAMIEELSS